MSRSKKCLTIDSKHIFYSWYNKNIELLKDYEYDDINIEKYDKLVDSCLGDITNRVYRDFNIDNILD